MSVREKFVEDTVMLLCKADPSLDEDMVRKFVDRKYKESLRDPTVVMDNNVTGAHEEIKLSSMCNWLDNKQPVISGNATFYMQPAQAVSPTSKMLRDLKQGRKNIKKEMFQAKKDGDDDKYQQLDLAQGNTKVIMNAEYGASGAPTAAFYTKYSPAATTLMAQSIITTMAAFFEGYVGDNQKYYHLNECTDWMLNICKKKAKEKIHDWIHVPTPEEVASRLKKHFPMYSPSYNNTIDGFVNHCSKEELVYLYYANNMKDFIRNHSNIRMLIRDILVALPLYEATEDNIPTEYQETFKSKDDYNSWVSNEMFLNPYSIPDCISSNMNKLTELMNKYIYIEYLTPDSIVKLNNHKRNTILLVDTDSNVINADIFIQFLFTEIFPGEKFGRRQMYNDMICVNILASVLDDCVSKLLDFYGRCRNMEPAARAELTMKNEFMFRKFFLMDTKKRYAASIVLREGNIMVPFKTEIKGMDFIKAGVTDDVSNRFTKMLQQRILFPDEIQLHGLMSDLKQFERDIRADLRFGGTRYLKLKQTKPEAAYKKRIDKRTGREAGGPWTIQVYKAAAMWNEIYPNQKIYSLDRVKILKLTISSESDLERIRDKYPDDYNTVMKKIFMSPDKNIANVKLKLIAIPTSVPKIPDWIIEFIDYDIAVSDITSSFRSILDSLHLEVFKAKTPNGNANVITSLISI